MPSKAHTVLYHGTMRLSMESANIDPRWLKKTFTGLQVKLTEYARRVFLAILLEGLLVTFKGSRSCDVHHHILFGAFRECVKSLNLF